MRMTFPIPLATLFAFFTAEICVFADGSDHNFALRVWQAEDGLPETAVTRDLQTSDGYLWLGTYGGLARFDGAHFTVFDSANAPGMNSSRVTSIYEAGDKTLWIGHEGGELTQYKDGVFKPAAFHSGWNSRSIYSINEDEDGELWVASPEGLLTRVSDRLTLNPPVGTTRGMVRVASSGRRIWVSRNGIVSELEHGGLVTLDLGGTNSLSYVQGICASRDGRFWVAINGRISKWGEGKWVEDLGVAPWGLAPVSAMIETRAGYLVAGTPNNGLFLVFREGEVQHLTRTNGLPSNWIHALCEDHEGNVWAGTHGGLVMLQESSLATVAPPDQWQNVPVLSVSPGAGGALWVGTEGAGLYQLKDGAWSHFGTEDGLPNLYIWSAVEDSDGRLWGGTWGSGVFVQNGNRFERVPGVDSNLVTYATFHAPDDSFWIGASRGLLSYVAGKVHLITSTNAPAPSDVRTMVMDTHGVLWFGMFGGGLACFTNGEVREFRKGDGLSSDFIQCLRTDVDGSLWIGTYGGGLNRLKNGHFSAIGRDQGLKNNVICDIEQDDRGFFWMSSYGGIMRVGKEELTRCADGLTRSVNCQSYDISDGLPTIECSGGLQPAGCKTPDGRLWFPTIKGLVSISPDEVRTNLLAPPVLIEKLLIDDQATINPRAGGPALQIPPGRHRIEFQYTGLSFVAPEKVRFKCRLSSLDKTWVDQGDKRAVNYSYIPPGRYEFQVTACNDDGVWNETGARLVFEVMPFFWQTTWFRMLAGGVALVASGWIAWQASRWRMRRRLERLERQRAVANERTRIAHDIHDDLGTHLTRIAMLSDPGRNELGGAQAASVNLNRIHGTARELTRAMDEIIWAANPHHDTLDSLVNYLHKFAQDFLENADIRCRVDVPYELPSWPLSPEVRHNLFLACKEALNNAVKHAGASEIRVRLELAPDSCTLKIEDNGNGFVLNAVNAGNVPAQFDGNGLKTMQVRLGVIGGHCEVYSVLGQGTTVTFRFPIQAP